MAAELRKSGIGLLGDMPWGTHFCQFYETKEDLLNILIPYFKTGLENNEFCMWVVCDPLDEEEARNALRQAVPEADRHLATGRIEIVPHTEWYLKGGAFDLESGMNGWKEKLDEALARGYAGMRVNANEAWLTKEDWKDFSQYEKKLNETIANQRIIVLCSYPLATSGAAEIFDVARTHQFAIALRHGDWEVVETPALKQAKSEIKRLNEELEQRVIERTRELAAANEELSREIIRRKRTETQRARNYRALHLISNSNRALVHTTDESGYLDEVCRIAVEVGGYRMAWIGFAEHDEQQTVRPVAQVGFETGYLESARITWADRERGRGPAGTAIRTGQPCIARNISDDPAFGPWRETAIRRGYQSAIALPLISEGRTFGILAVYAAQADAFDAEEVKILTELAYDLAFGLTLLRTSAERQQNVEALKESERQLAEAQRLAHVGSWNWDLQSNTVTWSEELYRISGLEPESFPPTYEASLLEVVHPEDRAAVNGVFEHALRTREPISFYFRILRPDEEERIIHSRGNIISDEHGKPIRMYGTAQDVTERRRAEEELRTSREQLRALARYLQSVREEERTRIARELHDEIGQALTGIKFSLETSTREKADNVNPELAQALGLINELIGRVRDLSLDLRPAMLDDLGLLPALRWHFERYTTQVKVKVDFKHAGLEKRRFAPEIETAAYRIVQEALTNVARHAEIDKVEVDVRADESTLRIGIKDLGRGFDPDSPLASPTVGLSGMRERAMMLGGQLEIESARGMGTVLTAELPLKTNAPTNDHWTSGR